MTEAELQEIRARVDPLFEISDEAKAETARNYQRLDALVASLPARPVQRARRSPAAVSSPRTLTDGPLNDQDGRE